MKYILIYILTGILITGCEDELINLAPVSEVSTDNFFQSESDFQSALYANYNGLQELNHINWKMQEVRSDNAFAHREEGGYDIDNFELTVTDRNIAEFWQTSYNVIFRSNIILDKINDIEMKQATRESISGQAKFIRALVYFDLVRSFGDVPMITKVIALSESYDMVRAPKEEVYQVIISDLSEAANILPLKYDNSEDIGRATKGAAKGLLGKVYLTMGDYSQAEVVLGDVINSGIYNLLPSYADIWKIENQNNEEIIFAIQYSEGTGNGNSFNYIFAPLTAGADVNPGTGLGFSRPTAELLRVYEEGDTRKSATLSPYEINPNTNDTTNLSYFRKFLADQLVQDGGQDWPILRYADILLMYAEALNELGDLEGAINILNMVRSRAFEGDSEKMFSTATINNSTQFKEVLLNERRLEFACENQRWFDLIRFNKAEDFLQVEVRREDFRTGEDLIIFETNMQEFQRLYPIPLEEIEKHNNLQPNPGY